MFCKLLFLILVTFLLSVAFIPDTKPYFGFDIELVDAPKLTLPESFSGPLLSNRLLSQAEHLYRDEVHGPESFATFNGRHFTGLADGRIVEILPDSVKTVASIDPEGLGNEECDKLYNQGRCGHPLGIRFDSRGLLYVADPFHGIWTVNISTGAINLLASTTTLDNAKFLDDLVLLETPTGLKIYLTDASTKWGLTNVGVLMAEHDQTGRLLSFDTKTGKVQVEWENLPFPNGLELVDDGSALLMVSLTHRLVYKYQISGQKAGQLTTLLSNLPGEPDNIKRSASVNPQTFWIALFTARNAHRPHIALDNIMKRPLLVRFIVRLQRSIGFTIQKIGEILDNSCLRQLGFDIKIGYSLAGKSCKYGMAVEIDLDGNLVNSIHSPGGATCSLSEVHELPQTASERHFLLGSAANRYLGTLSVPKSAFRSVQSEEKAKIRIQEPKSVPKSDPKPVPKSESKVESKSTTSTPKTTTQKPTKISTNQKVEL